MIGISSESFVCIQHFLFIVARRKPKLDLKILVMENKYLEKGKDFQIQPHKIQFEMEGTHKVGSLFVDVLIKRMIIEWYLFCF
jgi:hypothetical protein